MARLAGRLSFGDWFVLMQLNKNVNPVVFGNLVEELSKSEKLDLIKSISIAGPGFLNFYLNSNSIVHNINDIIKLNSDYGKNSSGEQKKAIVEGVAADTDIGNFNFLTQRPYLC